MVELVEVEVGWVGVRVELVEISMDAAEHH